MPALEDLRQCLERTQQHGELLQEFGGALKSRLLQPGANTSSILDIYVSTIKVGADCLMWKDRCCNGLDWNSDKIVTGVPTSRPKGRFA